MFYFLKKKDDYRAQMELGQSSVVEREKMTIKLVYVFNHANFLFSLFIKMIHDVIIGRLFHFVFTMNSDIILYL